ncbi:chain-length determining protein [Derxia lacustris]|uniref:chain-length determining protein n=1 Tax=Derxia lacustris TaxID=764842 RepID=UPI000A1721C6|nr:chain-length determining protein [Derxia lacustris]
MSKDVTLPDAAPAPTPAAPARNLLPDIAPAARRKSRWRRYPAFTAAFVATLLAALYWGLIASPRYVSEAHVIIQQADMPGGGQSVDFSSLLGGIGGGDRPNQMLLRDHLLSVDMLEKLDARLHLREHYSDPSRDPLSRLYARDSSIEWFYSYYQSRVAVEYDDYSGLLLLRVQAYTPEMATAIARALVEEGEQYMNLLGHRLAEVQVRFLESQVGEMRDRALAGRQKLLAFQNEHGMAAPENTAENVVGIVNRLDGQLTDLNTRKSALLGYLVPDSPAIVDINLQIAAVQKQLAQERLRLTASSGTPLNQTVEEYQRLSMAAQFDQDVYKTALSALEQGRIQAARTLKKVSVLQAPTVPQYSMEPRRLYNIAAFALLAFLLAAIVHLLMAVISEHRD